MKRYVVAATSLFAIVAAHGQGIAIGSAGSGIGAIAGSVQSGSPVSIALETTTVQTLGDGTHITRTTHEWFYRDSQGRTRMEFEMNSPAGQQTGPRTNVIVVDPGTAETTSWMTGQGFPPVYNVSKPHRAILPQTLAATRPAGADAASRPAPGAHPTIRREDLGTQNVQGAICRGTRTTTEYPLGMLGNDRPITVVAEQCMSREFGRVLSEHADDPRTGVRTLTVTSLSRGDPDPALFKPPPGFTERQQTAVDPK